MAVASRSTLVAAVVAMACGPCLAAEQGQIAYLAVTKGYWEVWTAKPDGSAARQVTRSATDKSRVSWFPDGKTLLVSRNDGVVLRVDAGGVETRIPLEQYPVVDAALSPDGQQLAFSFSTAIDGNDLWLARIDGGAAQKLATMNSLQHEPAWSADGQSLYFLSGDGGQAHDIWKLSLASRNTEQLTVGNLYHFDVAPCAEGALVFSSNRSGNYELYRQRADGTVEQLTDDPALDAKPTCAPDGAALIFESSRGGVTNLWRLDLATKSLRQVTRTREGARAPVWYAGGMR